MKFNGNAAVGLLIGTAAIIIMAAVPQASCARSAPQFLGGSNAGANADDVASAGRQLLIIDGTNSMEGRFPYIVALQRLSASGDLVFACTGTLIAPTIVMSPAHCYYDETPQTQVLVPSSYKNATAQIGRLSYPNLPPSATLTNDNFESIQVIDTVIHPKYNNFDGTNVDYDIAIHRLASPSTKTPATLNFDPNGPGEVIGTILTTIGWGYIQPVGPAGQVGGTSGTAITAPPMSGPSSASSAPSSLNSSATTGLGKSLIGDNTAGGLSPAVGSASQGAPGTTGGSAASDAIAALEAQALPITLQQGQYRVESLQQCKELGDSYSPLPPRSAVTPRMLCATSTAPTSANGVAGDTCAGDSGGPLLAAGTTAATDVIYGFTSWGISTDPTLICGSDGDLDFFTDVASLADFIRPYLANPGVSSVAPAAG